MVFNDEVAMNSTMKEDAAMLMNISGNRSRKTQTLLTEDQEVQTDIFMRDEGVKFHR